MKRILPPKALRPIFYVYEHWRPDIDLPFYVGKGHGKRAYSFNRKHQNKYYNRIVTKLAELGLCPEVRMVAGELIEKESYALEEERITFWKAQGVKLTNMSNGGEGKTGPHTPEHIANMSKALTGRVIHPNTIAGVIRGNKTRYRGPEYSALMHDIQQRIIAEGRNPGPTPETAIKIGNANSNPPESTRALMRAAKLGRHFITNGIDSRMIKPWRRDSCWLAPRTNRA
jgi:hypothetical protein